MINDLSKKVHENAVNKGFWEDVLLINMKDMPQEEEFLFTNNAIGARLMLIVTEVGEAMEAIRKHDMNNFAEELADTCIRVFDLANGLSIDLQGEIIKKMKTNLKREYKHGKYL